jgi:hypothetical protein
MNRTIRFVASFVGLGFILSATVALGAPLAFTIDRTRSQLTLTYETSPGSPFTTPQFPGSDTASIAGTAIVDVTGSSIQFLSTGNTQFALQPAAVAPAIGGAYPGSAPGQYGLLGLSPGVLGGPGPGGTAVLAARGLVAGGTSGVIPLIGNSFDASQLVLAYVAGTVDLNSLVLGNPFIGTFSAVGTAGNNQLTGGILTSGGGVDTLTVPIFSESTLNADGATILQEVSGQLVATAVVPEPSSMILASLAVAGLVSLAYRRRFA